MEGLGSQLLDACKNGNIEKLKQLLNSDPQININEHNFTQTPLYVACLYGQIEIVKFLLTDGKLDERQVNKSSQNWNCWTPFFVACYKGHVEIVKLLLNDERIDVNKEERFGKTPFFTVCERGKIEIVKLFLNDERININQAEDLFCRTAFWVACYEGNLQIVEFILASGREVDVNAKDKSGITAIEAAQEKRFTMKRLGTEKSLKRMEMLYIQIIELLKSFENNPDEIKFKLRLQLGIAGNELNFFFFLFPI